jgi:Acetyltransferase (GNAT) domain
MKLDEQCHETVLPIDHLPVAMSTRAKQPTAPRAYGTHNQPCLRHLRPAEYPLWDALLDESPQGNVFCRSWFLEAVSADIRIMGCFLGKRLVAGIPLYFERRLGMRFCRMPPLVHTWGIVMAPFEGKPVTVFSRQMKVLTLFARELAKQRFFIQSFHPTQVNWLPFYWSGFRQQIHYTNVIEDLGDSYKIWRGMECNTRRNIRKAERAGIAVVTCDADLVTTMSEKTFRHQHKSLPYAREHVNRLYRAAKQHNAGECLAAVDRSGRTHAAAFVLWDHKRAYSVTGGTDPQLRSSGAQSLLLWHMLRLTSSQAVAFDFAGSVVEQIERFFIGFGAKLVPYNRIMKLPRPMWATLALTGI